MRLLDSTVAIDYLRGVPAAVDTVERDTDELAASEVTRFEILAGVRPGEEAATEAFFSVFLWVPVDEAVARSAAGLARRYRAAHSGIEDADYLIAATSLLLEAELLTTNVRHFPMLEGLTAAYS